MKELLKNNLFFILAYLVFIILAGIVLILFSKSEIHLFINHYHCFFGDRFFILITLLGSGTFAILLSLSLLFVRYRLALFMFLSYAISGIAVQIIKNLFFPHNIRPYEYFRDIQGLYFVPGINLNVFQSFPSGHAATAFSVFFCLSLALSHHTKKYYGLIFFLIALMIAFSRVYLSQHFLVDIYFGSLTGVLSTLIFAKFILLSDKKWLDRSVLSHSNGK